MNDATSTANMRISYLRLRRIMGILAVSLPIILMIWGFFIHGFPRLENSISDYYSLRTRDALVGILVAISWFLITYPGYEPDNKMSKRTWGFYPLTDNMAGFLAGGFALGVAFFPNSGGPLERVVHFASAAGLFVLLAYFCLVLFTKTKPPAIPNPTRGIWNRFRSYRSRFSLENRSSQQLNHKVARNRIYLICGLVMLVCIVSMGIYSWILEGKEVLGVEIDDLKPVFWLESIALWAFGISWFVKGETLWKDERKWWKLFERSSGKTADQSVVNQGTVDAL